MADILIKGMEMPKGDEVLSLTIYPDGGVYLYNIEEVATAVALPPHGRLSDLDKLVEEFDGHGVYMEEEVKKIIDFFPAVVEANNGTDN